MVVACRSNGDGLHVNKIAQEDLMPSSLTHISSLNIPLAQKFPPPCRGRAGVGVESQHSRSHWHSNRPTPILAFPLKGGRKWISQSPIIKLMTLVRETTQDNLMQSSLALTSPPPCRGRAGVGVEILHCHRLWNFHRPTPILSFYPQGVRRWVPCGFAATLPQPLKGGRSRYILPSSK